MIKVFISQPMRGKSDEQILKERSEAIENVKRITSEDVEIIDSFIEYEPDDLHNVALWYLGRSLELLSYADVAYFVKGWWDARGCKIEHECAESYGVSIIEEEE